ncbi:MAG: DUF3298 domain-containing protein [Selenomonadaceae bacterium]|nr:DUF3298 domain-containing protein [Selenomonadaceae bacterium]
MKQFIIAAALFLLTNVASAAQIDSADYLGDPRFNYPVVVTDSPIADARINSVIRAEVQRFVEAVEKQAQENDMQIGDISVDFKIPCNHNGGILSVLLTEYIYYEKAAHPSTIVRALNFNSYSGVRLTADSLSEIGSPDNGEPRYTPKNVTRKLREHVRKNNLFLYDDFTELEQLPEDFYFDDELNVIFIFQQYEVAPYAIGIIQVNAGK